MRDHRDDHPDDEVTRADDTVDAGQESTVWGTADIDAGEMPRVEGVPPTIGQYRILSKLGEGGMGVVYEAEQQSPRRRVAVKVVRGGAFVDEARVRMFQREADTLARLEHPNIGGIHESGRTPDGQHFFAMELVQGETLDRFLAGREEVESREELHFRLALFRKIADAVHYAHQRGVIHRDLKPTNVVVTEEATRDDGTLSSASTAGMRIPEIKILDFGLARITEGDVAAATMTTEVGVIKGTLPYMSPEQARGNPEEIDWRTDVYALGVILYEMLTGQRPYDVMKRSLVEAVRVICEESPRSLSAALSGRRLDPDIETIVGKALEKNPERRYASAAALSEDISRHLASQPILARPPSTMYQLRKFARRNRALVAGVAVVFVVLVGASIVSTLLFFQAERARATATKERDAAQAVTTHLTDMLSSVDPRQAQGREITVREILDKSAKTVGTAFPDQPEVEASVRYTLGETYRVLGDGDEADRQFTRSAELRRNLYGEVHPATLESLAGLAHSRFSGGQLEEAEPLQRKILAGRRETLGPEHVATLWAQHDLVATLRDRGRHLEAEPIARELVPLTERILGPDHELSLSAKYALATIVDLAGDRKEAEALFADVVDRRLRILGDRHLETLWAMTLLSYIQSKLGKHDEAEARLNRVIAIQTELLGANHFDTLWSTNILGEVYYRQKRYDEAESTLRRVLDERLKLLGEKSRDTLWTMSYLGHTLCSMGRLEDAEQTVRSALKIRRDYLGEENWDTLWSKQDLANILRRRGELDEAEQLVRECLEVRGRDVTGNLVEYRDNLLQLGLILTAQQCYPDAEETLLEAARLLDEYPDAKGYREDEIVPGLVALYDAWHAVDPGGGHAEQAASWRARLP